MLIDRLLAIPGVVCVQLIGSRLVGYGCKDSDVDLLVYVTPEFHNEMNKKRSLLTTGVLCHWEFIPLSNIIPPIDIGPKWRHFGAQQFRNLENKHILRNTQDGEILASTLLKHKVMISRCGAEIVWDKFGSKIHNNVLLNPSTSVVIQSLISLNILNNEQFNLEDLRGIKNGTLSIEPFINKIKMSHVNIQTRLNIDEVNHQIYKDFLAERENYGIRSQHIRRDGAARP